MEKTGVQILETYDIYIYIYSSIDVKNGQLDTAEGITQNTVQRDE